MQKTPRSNRVHIGVIGRCNVGKSSLINALANQEVSLVSEVAGTTTDPVYKNMELHPAGPVVLVDTAGLDEDSALGSLRRDRTRRVLSHIDLLLLATDPDRGFSSWEQKVARQAEAEQIPVLWVTNKADTLADVGAESSPAAPADKQHFWVSAETGEGIGRLRQEIMEQMPKGQEQPLAGDLIGPGDTVLMVTPIDEEAPKGRMILPQAQVLRDILDHGGSAFVCQPAQIPSTLSALRRSPRLVITDSQAFQSVAEHVPADIPLTSFSILFARQKGDLAFFQDSTAALGQLRPGDSVLVSEACSHHPVGEDIGRVKIPRWLQERFGTLHFDFAAGREFPDDLQKYAAVIHCGGCMLTRRQMLCRLESCRQHSVPMVNYGIVIAYLHGLFPRALQGILDLQGAAGTEATA